MNSYRRWRFLASVLIVLPLSPVLGEDLAQYSGSQLYQRFCASCHGKQALGDGPVASFFKLSPPDLTRIAARHGGQFPDAVVGKIIDGRDPRAAHGARNMPVWGYEFYFAGPGGARGEEQAGELVARLVAYLRTIQKP